MVQFTVQSFHSCICVIPITCLNPSCSGFVVTSTVNTFFNSVAVLCIVLSNLLLYWTRLFWLLIPRVKSPVPVFMPSYQQLLWYVLFCSSRVHSSRKATKRYIHKALSWDKTINRWMVFLLNYLIFNIYMYIFIFLKLLSIL